MIEKFNAIPTTSAEDVNKPDNEQKNFTKKIVYLNALATGRFSQDNFDMEKAMKESRRDLEILGVTGGLQEMLAAEILSIHHLQQLSIAMACETSHVDTSGKQFYTNAAIKLANCFTQLVNLLSRLQGNGSQKITVEHVNVHQGGQAIVGNINGGTPTSMGTK